MNTNEQKYITCKIYRADYNSNFNFYHENKSVFIPVNRGIYSIRDIENSNDSDGCSKLPVMLVRRNLSNGEYIHAEPNKPGSWAFGGSYLACSDSRVNEINKYPIPLHDRDMNLEKR